MKRLLSLIAGCSLLLFGCGENEALYYEGEPDGTSGIYFAYNVGTTHSGSSTIYNYRDTTNVYSLTSTSLDYLTVRIPVRLFGNVSETDRPYSVEVVGGTAQENVDFSVVGDLVMEGGKSLSYLTVNLNKKDYLQDGEVRFITIGLKENEYFKPYIKKRLVVNDTIDAQTITIRYSMLYQQPIFWYTSGSRCLGDFSQKKLMLILEVMGWTYSEFTSKNLYSIAPGVALFMQQELQKRADNNQPERETDGSFMQLNGDYKVDYSAYE